MHRSRHEKWVDLSGFRPSPYETHSVRSHDWEDIKATVKYWMLVLFFTCFWVALFITASLYFSTEPEERYQRPIPTHGAGFSSIEKTGVYIAHKSDLRGCDNKLLTNQLGGFMPVVKYFGVDSDMENVYNGRRWWLFKHQWMPEVGGICRIVILGRVWEIYRRQPWQELAKKTSSVSSRESVR